MSTVEDRAAHWLKTGRGRGVSAMAIFAVMTGKRPDDDICYPHDDGDLGRCIGLLRLIPEWRRRLDEMKPLGAEWSALVEHWEELEALHKGDCKAVYRRMRDILDPIEAKRPGVLKFGGGTLYMGGRKR